MFSASVSPASYSVLLSLSCERVLEHVYVRTMAKKGTSGQAAMATCCPLDACGRLVMRLPCLLERLLPPCLCGFFPCPRHPGASQLT